jgi:predicted metal-dependent enzyme (double-stranded beta helix superfamily)
MGARKLPREEDRMFNMEDFIAECRAALGERTPQVAMKEAVARAVSDRAELERVLGPAEEGGIRTILASPELTMINVVWAPEMSIWPHEHRMWAVIGIYGGQEDNQFYRRTAEGIQPASGRSLRERDALVLGEDVVHAVRNPLRSYTGAIHVYAGDFFNIRRSDWDAVTLKEQPYDINRVRRAFEEGNRRAKLILKS